MAHPARTNSLFAEKADQRGRLSQFGLHNFVQIKQNMVKSRHQRIHTRATSINENPAG
jgi:hypothetical protein